MGNLTRVQPILVNDRFEIVDGQHRFTACQELGLPIYYTVVPGLGINEARGMNILHRGWTIADYARSYAASGDPNYQKYLMLMDDYGFNHSITLMYTIGTDSRDLGVFKAFRNGGFVIQDEAATRDRLDKLTEVGEYTDINHDRQFARAFLKVIQSENYDHRRMIAKLRLYGGRLKRLVTLDDNLRQLEDVYNYGQTEAHRARLY